MKLPNKSVEFDVVVLGLRGLNKTFRTNAPAVKVDPLKVYGGFPNQCLHVSYSEDSDGKVVNATRCSKEGAKKAQNGFLCSEHQSTIRSLKRREVRNPDDEAIQAIINRESKALLNAPREVIKLVTSTGAKIQFLSH